MEQQGPDVPEGAVEALKRAKYVTVLTGAGVSAESGIPTFRGEDGLWKNFRAEELATPEAFSKDPKLVWEWYDWRRGIIGGCHPNAAHGAIADLEKRYHRFLLITQNVDGLHRRAGSRALVELHGNLWRMRCTWCFETSENHEVPLKVLPPPCRACGKPLRPDVVWFGEGLDPDTLERALTAAAECDVMLVAGTSAVVQPAASLPVIAANSGAVVMEFNIGPTPLTGLARHGFMGKASETLPSLLGALNGQ
jgi:NAD-dependent deacetylase